MKRRTFLALLVPAAVSLPALAAHAYTNDFTKKPFDQAAFAAAENSGAPVLIHVLATWCETCAAQREVLNKLRADPAYKAFVVFNVDFDAEKAIMRTFGAQSRSTLIVFKGKTEVGRLVGDTREASITALMKKAL
jgi:thioredoxin 1